MSTFGKIPFQLRTAIILRSASNPAHQAKSRVLGVVENSFIIIEKPVFTIGEHSSAIVEGTIVCNCLLEGCLFTFESTFQTAFSENIICIDYPHEFEVKQLRKYPRINVNLAVEAGLDAGNQMISGQAKDISASGGLLEFPKMVSIFKGVEFPATLTLPNDKLVTGVLCKVMNTRFLQFRKYTEAGVSFLGPPAELEKIQQLCRFCMRFKV